MSSITQTIVLAGQKGSMIAALKTALET